MEVIRVLIFAINVSGPLFGHALSGAEKPALDAYFILYSGWGARAITNFEEKVRVLSPFYSVILHTRS